MSTAIKPWRESASLIMLARRQTIKVGAKRTNYDILFQKRVNSATSFPNSIVFPGGVLEEMDLSHKWIEHFQSCGVERDRYSMFCAKQTELAPIFQGDPVKRHIGLRITAIREVFEELGILICSHKGDSNNAKKSWSRALTNFDVKEWQRKVHNNSEEFLQLCRSLDCYPDIWALHYWSNWLTPAFYDNRFDTAFFVAAFDEKPQIIFEESEVAGFRWAAIEDVLEKSAKREIELLPPQQYELLRLSRHPDLGELVRFAEGRGTRSGVVYSPVRVLVKDGAAFILPGDDMYPKKMDYSKNYSYEDKTKTLQELRMNHSHIHRFEKDALSWRLISNLHPMDS